MVRCVRRLEKEKAMHEMIPYIELAAQVAKLITYLMVMRRLGKSKGARKRP